MKKWEEQQKMKTHRSKLKNAKAQVSSFNPKSPMVKEMSIKSINLQKNKIATNFQNSQLRQVESAGSIMRTQNLLNEYNDYEKEDPARIPLYRVLKLQGLQQYAKALISRGYGYKLSKITLLNSKEQDQLFQAIKVLPGHKTKLLIVFHQLADMSSQLEEYEALGQRFLQSQESVLSSQQYMKQRENFTTGQNLFYQKNKEISQYTQPNEKYAQKKQYEENKTSQEIKSLITNNQKQQNMKGKVQIERIGYDYFAPIDNENSDEMAQQLDILLKKYEGFQNLNLELIQKEATKIELIQKETMKIEPQSTKNQQINQLQQPHTIQQNNPQKPINSQPEPSHLPSKQESLKLIQKLQNALPQDDGLPSLQQVRQFYQSFDTGKMTSTLVNLDIEEMCFCLSCALEKHLEFTKDQQLINEDSESEGEQCMEESKDFFESFDEKQSEELQQGIEQILRESFYPQSKQLTEFQELQEPVGLPQGESLVVLEESTMNNNNNNPNNNNGNQANPLLEQSMFSQYQPQNPQDIEAKAKRKRFRYAFNEKGDQKFCEMPTRTLIQNYCKNVIVTAKMEKEVIIISLIYIEKLIISAGVALSHKNWKRVSFVALILASKIWDDESYENDNFAKAFPTFTVQEINEIEQIFLGFIDYNLMIKGAEYAKYYFILRAFAEKNKRSFPLRPLDLDTIMSLQKNQNKAVQKLKEQYATSLNKSF